MKKETNFKFKKCKNFHHIFAKKSLGQNFLNNFSVVENMCKNVKIENKVVLEIGPGTGFLTKEIIKHNPKKLILIEKDERLIKKLNEDFSDIADIINADALKINIIDIAKTEKQKITIIANLPYNIGTTLIINWLKCIENIENIVVILQKEIVDRFCAIPKTKNYGRVSVLIQSVCDIKKLFDIKPECFTPQPKVMSSVVKITQKQEHMNEMIIYKLNEICKIAFSQRRKKLSNVFKKTNFNGFFSHDILEKRAEEISVKEYIELAKYCINNNI